MENKTTINNQSTNQSINQSTNQSIKSTNQPFAVYVNRPWDFRAEKMTAKNSDEYSIVYCCMSGELLYELVSQLSILRRKESHETGAA